MKNQIIVDSSPRNYYGGFVLIKPTKPFYKVGEDYQLLSFPNNEVIAKARLVMKRTYHINRIPEVACIMCRDLRGTDLKRILKEHSTEVYYDVLVFSANSHYNDWYADREEETKVMRKKDADQISAF
ncbi:hypothetical protein [Flagellimonas sp.]|uniref:hypothetical protein n=1 Tax=Flagellimonas sp. TaxID=2058762 RepID=UPI003BA9E747